MDTIEHPDARSQDHTQNKAASQFQKYTNDLFVESLSSI
jgi:hypothetical protein